MNAILGEFARQIILVVFYVIVIIIAVRLGVMFAKKKNAKESAATSESTK